MYKYLIYGELPVFYTRDSQIYRQIFCMNRQYFLNTGVPSFKKKPQPRAHSPAFFPTQPSPAATNMTSDESSAAERVFAIIDLAANIAEHVGGREAWRMMLVSQAARAGVKEWLRRLVVEEERAGENNNAWELVHPPPNV